MTTLILSLAAWPSVTQWIGIAGVVTTLWADPRLTPEAQAWLAPPAEHLAPQDNLYYWLLGFDAPAGSDPVARGQAVHAALMTANSVSRTWGEFEYIDPPSASPLVTTDGRLRALCNVSRPDCFLELRRQAVDVMDIAERHEDLLDRYRGLYTVADMQTLSPVHVVGSMKTIPIDVSHIHRLHLARIAVHPDPAEAATALAQDIVFARRVLGLADEMILKAMAMHWLGSDLQLYAQLLDIDAYPLDALHPVSTQLAPLTPSEWDMTGVLKREFRTTARSLIGLVPEPQPLAAGVEIPGSLFRFNFKPNATINLLQQAIAETAHRMQMTPKARRAAGPLVATPPLLQRMTNSQGWFIVQFIPSANASYGDRLRDLDGLIRLVNLKREILRQGVADDRIPEWLAAQGAEWRDPYTGEPMRWDADARRLYFEGHGEKPEFREVFFTAAVSD